MAKAKIKKLNQFVPETYVWTRLGQMAELTPIELERGDGKYLGLSPDKVSLADLELITAKDDATQKDSDKGHKAFLGKICGMFNAVVFRPYWREVLESYETDAKLDEAQQAKVLADFADKLNSWFSEETIREKNSVWYYKRATELMPKLTALKDEYKNPSTTPERKALVMEEHKQLVAEKNELIATAKIKEAEEQAGLLEGLDELE